MANRIFILFTTTVVVVLKNLNCQNNTNENCCYLILIKK